MNHEPLPAQGPVDVNVRQLADDLLALAYDRAGGGPSDESGRYDPELLDVMGRAAECITRLAEQIDRAAIACAHHESQAARAILLDALKLPNVEIQGPPIGDPAGMES